MTPLILTKHLIWRHCNVKFGFHINFYGTKFGYNDFVYSDISFIMTYFSGNYVRTSPTTTVTGMTFVLILNDELLVQRYALLVIYAQNHIVIFYTWRFANPNFKYSASWISCFKPRNQDISATLNRCQSIMQTTIEIGIAISWRLKFWW